MKKALRQAFQNEKRGFWDEVHEGVNVRSLSDEIVSSYPNSVGSSKEESNESGYSLMRVAFLFVSTCIRKYVLLLCVHSKQPKVGLDM